MCSLLNKLQKSSQPQRREFWQSDVAKASWRFACTCNGEALPARSGDSTVLIGDIGKSLSNKILCNYF